MPKKWMKMLVVALAIGLLFGLGSVVWAAEGGSGWLEFNDNHERIEYSGRWISSASEGAFGGTEHGSDRASAYAEFTFYGTGVRWMGRQGANRGQADVYLNGELVAEGLDTYHEETLPNQVLFERTGLEPGTYTLRIDPTGESVPEAFVAHVSIEGLAYIPTVEGLISEVEELQEVIAELKLASRREMAALDHVLGPYANEVLAGMIREARELLETTEQKRPEDEEALARFVSLHGEKALDLHLLQEAIEDAKRVLDNEAANIETLKSLDRSMDDFRTAAVIYYSFDREPTPDIRPARFGAVEGDFVHDESGNNHHGLIIGQLNMVEGIRGNAAEFYDEAYIDLGGETFPARDIPTDGITVSAWVNCRPGNHHEIFCARSSTGGWLFHPEVRSGGTYRWLVRTGRGDTIFEINSGEVEWDTWVHFAGVYCAIEHYGAVYIDGKLVELVEIDPEDAAFMSQDWGMGARVGMTIDDARPFTGFMDDFVLWNRALTVEEIRTLMEEGPGL